MIFIRINNFKLFNKKHRNNYILFNLEILVF